MQSTIANYDSCLLPATSAVRLPSAFFPFATAAPEWRSFPGAPSRAFAGIRSLNNRGYGKDDVNLLMSDDTRKTYTKRITGKFLQRTREPVCLRYVYGDSI